MSIRTDLVALTAYRHSVTASNAVAVSLERLSTGYRINRAADDAAGLSIARGMQAQLGGKSMALRNTRDGISFMQTTDGALTQTHAILQRMRDLTIQAANTGALNDEAKTSIQNELTAHADELTRLTSTTSFNGHAPLSGGYLGTFQVGAGAGDVLHVAFTQDMSAAGLKVGALAVNGGLSAVTLTTGTPDAGGVVGTSSTYALTFTNDDDVAAFTGGLTDAATDFTVNGAPVDLRTVTTRAGLASAITSAGAGVHAVADAGGVTLTSDTHTASSVAVVGMVGTETAGTVDVVPFGGVHTTLTGQLDLTYTGGVITLGPEVSFDLSTVHLDASQSATDRAATLRTALEGAFAGTDVTVSDTGALTMQAQVPAATAFTAVVAGTGSALDAIDAAIRNVSNVRADVGAIQNRFEHIVTGLSSSFDALTAAHGRVRDVDMAAEVVTLTREQIMATVSTAMLAQANSTSQNLLQLLRT